MSNSPRSGPVQGRLHIYRELEEMTSSVAEEISRLVNDHVSRFGICHLVLPGGRSVQGILERLREQRIPWSSLQLYMSDERCVPVIDQNRNDRLIYELLVPYVPLPSENVHRIAAEMGPEEGAARYSSLLNRTPRFDLVLLGMGADGHTASLFPGHVALNDHSPAVPVRNAPKPPPERVSIGLTRLQAASERWIVASGSEKQNVLLQVQRGADLPVTMVRPTAFFADLAAAGTIDRDFENSRFIHKEGTT